MQGFRKTEEALLSGFPATSLAPSSETFAFPVSLRFRREGRAGLQEATELGGIFRTGLDRGHDVPALVSQLGKGSRRWYWQVQSVVVKVESVLARDIIMSIL